MNITEVKIRKPKNSKDTGIKAIAALVIDNVFIVNDIQIILTKSSKLFIKYPQNCFNQTMLGFLLATAEVPRIAQAFGLETSAKANIGGAVHTVSSTVCMIKSFAR